MLWVDLARIGKLMPVDEHASAADRYRVKKKFRLTAVGQRVYFHVIRMRDILFGFVEDDIGIRTQHLAKHAVGAVSLSGESKRAEKLHAVPPLPETRKRVPGYHFGTYRVRA